MTVQSGMLSIHANALQGPTSVYHEFLLRYSKVRRIVYGFVEGKQDPCFYRGFIELLLPEDWDLELWTAGNKDRVYQLHAALDFRRFPKNRVCFFVDCDLSKIVPEKLKQDKNIFVTNGYSIENDIVNAKTFKRIVTEVFGFANAAHDDLDQLEQLFDRELEKFCLGLIQIMVWILFWRRSKQRANLNNIAMKDIFSIEKGELKTNGNLKGKTNVAEYIHDQCELTYDTTVNVAPIEVELKAKHRYRQFARGKYLFWFMTEFCHSVYSNAAALCPSVKNPKMNVTVSAKNAMTVIGNRARIPSSLRKFINSTFCSFIRSRTPKKTGK